MCSTLRNFVEQLYLLLHKKHKVVTKTTRISLHVAVYLQYRYLFVSERLCRCTPSVQQYQWWCGAVWRPPPQFFSHSVELYRYYPASQQFSQQIPHLNLQLHGFVFAGDNHLQRTARGLFENGAQFVHSHGNSVFAIHPDNHIPGFESGPVGR